MKARRELLEKLHLSLDNSVMLGIQIQSAGGKQFLITLVEKIIDNPEDIRNTIIYLKERDISGNVILPNPITLGSVTAVRIYSQLKGSYPETVKAA